MKKYIQPLINIKTFNTEKILTLSVTEPTDTSGYRPSDDSASFNSTTYMLDWNK